MGLCSPRRDHAGEGSKLRNDGVVYHKTSSFISTALGILYLFPVTNMTWMKSNCKLSRSVQIFNLRKCWTELLTLYRWAMHGNIRVVCVVTKCHWASDFGRFEGSMLTSFLGSCSRSLFSPRDTLSYPIRLKCSVTPLWEVQIWRSMCGLSVWRVLDPWASNWPAPCL